MKNIYLIFSFIILITFCSCEKSRENNAFTSTASKSSGSQNDYLEVVEEEEIAENNENVIERKLIKRGDVSFKTSDIDKTRLNIQQVTRKYKGYISSDTDESNTYRDESRITIRVPSKNFDLLLGEISKGIEKFDKKNIIVDDVTEEFLDISARIKTKKELEKRYLVLLNKTKSVKEILEVEKELESVRSEIESIEGRLKYLQNNISYSTLNTHFYKEKEIRTSGNENKFGKRIGKAFKNGFEGIKTFLLLLINIWPLILIITIVYFIIKKIRYKKRIKKQ